MNCIPSFVYLHFVYLELYTFTFVYLQPVYLREDKPVPAEGLTVTELVEFPAVKAALDAVNEATAGLAKRSADLGVVKMAPSAKVGYRALDMMATAGAVKPDVRKALDEAKTLVEREEKERKSKGKEDKGHTGSHGQHKRPYAQEGGCMGSKHLSGRERVGRPPRYGLSK